MVSLPVYANLLTEKSRLDRSIRSDFLISLPTPKDNSSR